MIDENPEIFERRHQDAESDAGARSILRKYDDQRFSYVDAVIFSMVDADRSIGQILTVDGRDFSTYRFAHPVEVIVP